MRRVPHGDDGSVLVLVLGLFAVLLLLVGVVVDVSAVVLARRSLSSTADGAAVAAAQALDEAVFYTRGPGEGVPLSPAGVAQQVASYAGAVADDQPGLVLTGAVDGGYTAVVTARRTVEVPFGGWLGVGAGRAGGHGPRPLAAGRVTRASRSAGRSSTSTGRVARQACSPATRATSAYVPSCSSRTVSDGWSGSTTQYDGTPASS